MRYKFVKSREESIRDIQKKFKRYGGISYNKNANLSLITPPKDHIKSCKCELCEFKRENNYGKKID